MPNGTINPFTFSPEAMAGTEEFISKAVAKGGAAPASAGAAGLWSLLKAGKYGAALKTPAGSIGAFFLLQMILNRLTQHYGGGVQRGIQERAIAGQAGASPEDVYYQAMLPSLTQQRQVAQNALLQAILSGSGQVPSVPGERVIGGG